MKIGDLVRYRGWEKNSGSGPMALVVDVRSPQSDFHKRIRVAWLGESIPIQASVISTTGERISSWCTPKYFEIISEY